MDPPMAFYAVLAALALVSGAVAFRSRKRSGLSVFAASIAALLGLFVIDRTYESPREEVVRKIGEMGEASRASRFDDLFRHVSESFKYKSLNKAGLQAKARMAQSMEFGGISEHDLGRSNFTRVDDATIVHWFRIRSHRPDALLQVEGTFKKEADGQWRLIGFRLFDPVNRNDEKEVPGL